MWGWVSGTPAEPEVDPNVYGTTAKKFQSSDFDLFLKQCDDKSPEWIVAYEDPAKDLRVFKKDTGNSINLLRACVVFKDIKPETLYDILHDHLYRKSWDENMIDGHVIEMIDNTTEIGYYACRMPTPVQNRDFVNQRSWERREGMWLVVNHSVLTDKAPPKEDFVRAWSYQTGYLIRLTPEGHTQFIYLTQSDPKGWIPGWVVNNLISTIGPSYIDTISRVAREYDAWKKTQPDHQKPWLNDGFQ